MSLCYQLPGLHLDGITVVVSPHISLMKAEADKREQKGIAASILHRRAISRRENAALGDASRNSTGETKKRSWKQFDDGFRCGTCDICSGEIQ